MSTSTPACRACGRPLGETDQRQDFANTLADVGGVLQPPEAAGLISGATTSEGELGTTSGPVEYADDELCASCRAQREPEESR